MAPLRLGYPKVALFIGVLAFWRCDAVEQGLRGPSSDDKAIGAMSPEIAAMVQGPMLLSAALPHHDGHDTASQKQSDQMAEAGQSFYKSYTIFQNAEQSLGAFSEQLSMKKGSATAAGLADVEAMMQQAKAKLKEGEALARQAKDSFFNNANPLGDPPEAPREWDKITAMAMRAKSKLTALGDQLKDAKHLARQQGVSLSGIVVSNEKAVLLKDAYGEKKDNEILDFLNGY